MSHSPALFGSAMRASTNWNLARMAACASFGTTTLTTSPASKSPAESPMEVAESSIFRRRASLFCRLTKVMEAHGPDDAQSPGSLVPRLPTPSPRGSLWPELDQSLANWPVSKFSTELTWNQSDPNRNRNIEDIHPDFLFISWQGETSPRCPPGGAGEARTGGGGLCT